MLRSVLLKTLRDQRWQALAWSCGLGLLVLVTAAGIAKAYPDAASRQLLAQQLNSGLSAAQVIYGKPIAVDRFSGLLAWRGLGISPVLIGLFLVLAATSVTRGAEERGELDVVLVAARSRSRLFAEQAGALLVLLVAVCTAIWLALLIADSAAGEPALDPGRGALAALNIGLGAGLFAASALLVAQFVATRRSSALIASGALFAAQIWSNLGLVATSLDGARRLSPLYLVSRSTPLANGHVDVRALLLLAALTLACGSAAGWCFARRDFGAAIAIPTTPVLRRMSAKLEGTGGGWLQTRLLRSSFERGLRGSLGSALIWGISLGALAVLFAALTPAVSRSFVEQANVQQFVGRFGRGDVRTASGFLSLALFAVLPLLMTLFATTLATDWSGQERAGRLDVELTSPVSRSRCFAASAAAALLSIAIVVAVAGTAFLVAARIGGLDLVWGRAIGAMALLVPLAGAVAAFGYAVSAWRPGPVAAVLGAVLALSYFLDLLAPLFNFPDAARYLSVFHLYGQPLSSGVSWGGVVALLVVIAVCLVIGTLAFN
ncbi:MAG: hypothetical protein ACYDCQ_16595, partial [Dehalococcoidia bacterium]